MKSLLHAPLFKICLSFIAGVYTAKFQIHWPLWSLFPACLLFMSILGNQRRCLGSRWEGLFAVSVIVVFLGLGNAWYTAHSWSPVKKQIDALVHCNARLMGTVISKVKKNEYGRRTWLELLAYREDSLTHLARGRLQLYLKPEDTVRFERGDTLLVHANIRPARSKYPSYLSWLKDHDIRVFAYSQKTQVRYAASSLQSWMLNIQAILSQKLAATFSDTLLMGIAQAMFLGEKQLLDAEVRGDFAAAGLSHILAISGLHVGIVFLALAALLAPLHYLPHGLRLKNLIILLALLVYMGVTGLSPAVVRAVLMFGTILLFRIIYRRYHILNLLAISAMLQTLFSPEIVFNLGFQLSYLAVLGIVLCMPVFEQYFYTSHAWLNKLYGWMGVSLIATACTTPLIWYHFGQFPTYFIVSNVLISAIVFMLVLLGFLLVLFIWIPGLNELLGYLCEQLIGLLYWLTHAIANWPGAIIQADNLWGRGLLILLVELLVTIGVLFVPVWVKYYSQHKKSRLIFRVG